MMSTIVDFPKENSSLNERLNALEDFYVNNVLSEERSLISEKYARNSKKDCSIRMWN